MGLRSVGDCDLGVIWGFHSSRGLAANWYECKTTEICNLPGSTTVWPRIRNNDIEREIASVQTRWGMTPSADGLPSVYGLADFSVIYR